MSDQPEDPHPLPLLTFEEFEKSDYEAWHTATVATLNGAAFEKLLTTQTYEGIVLQPLYRRDDVQQLTHQDSLPGTVPYVRGSRSTGYQDWDIAQELPYASPESFNTALRDDLKHGQTAINLVLDHAAQAGLDPDSALDSDVGRGGVSIANSDDLVAALADIDLDTTPLMIQPGAAALPVTALLTAYLQQTDRNPVQLIGSIAFDPLGNLAQIGTLPQTLHEAYDDMALATLWAGPHFDTINVNTAIYHNSGANAVQELAYMLATGVEYIRQMLDRGLFVDDVANHMQFTTAIGSNFFMEIAKLRAARMLWSQAAAAFGADEEAQKMTLHTGTGQLNKTITDPYVNMLRTTIESFAGAVGGIDSIHVAPFDCATRVPNAFARRIARNQQLILQAECNLVQLADPAGGSWYVETLTDWLAQTAWSHFQAIEATGGMFAALKANIIQQQIGAIAEQRLTNIKRRKDVLVGTNMYANNHETPLNDNANHAAVAEERKGQIHRYRTERATGPNLSGPQNASTTTRLEEAITAAANGATLGELSAALWESMSEKPIITPLTPLRLSEPFEILREAATNFAERRGHPPQIFLANMGPLRQHKARAEFITGFFEVGGFELLNNSGFETPSDAAEAALTSGAEIVVICSTDETYPEIVPPLVQQIKADRPDMYIVVAGYPQDQIADHEAAGVDEFIHARSNCYEMNHQLQRHLGVST